RQPVFQRSNSCECRLRSSQPACSREGEGQSAVKTLVRRAASTRMPALPFGSAVLAVVWCAMMRGVQTADGPAAAGKPVGGGPQCLQRVYCLGNASEMWQPT